MAKIHPQKAGNEKTLANEGFLIRAYFGWIHQLLVINFSLVNIL